MINQHNKWLWIFAVVISYSWTFDNIMAQDENCLGKFYNNTQQKDADYFFDLKFDKTRDGQSFSCDLGIRASDARKSLETFQFGFLYDSEKHINDSISFPLVARIYKSRKVYGNTPDAIKINNFNEWLDFKSKNFSPLQSALINCANIHNIKIMKSGSGGFFIGDGRIWFVPTPNDSLVRVLNISLYPVESEYVTKFCSEVSGLDIPIGDTPAELVE